jgi:tyrosyl-tRNA synthetase
MLTFDSVKLRLDREQPLTFLEFNYMILQAYDFRELSRRRRAGCSSAGRTNGAISSTASSWRAGWTAPSVTASRRPHHTADGAKMGKTASGAVWLNADQLPPTIIGSSGGTRRCRRREVPEAVHGSAAGADRELAKLEGQAINEAKIVLANEATAMLHGRSAAGGAETARRTFEEGQRRRLADAAVPEGRSGSSGADRLGSRVQRRGAAQDRRGRGQAEWTSRQRPHLVVASATNR